MIQTIRIGHALLFGVTISIIFAIVFRPRLKSGFPPDDIHQCTVILGAKSIGTGHVLTDPFAALTGARHLFVNYFLNATNYGIIEGGYIETKFGYRGLSTAHIRPYAWDHGGFQWHIPTGQCMQLIDCLHAQTRQYHRASHPYNFALGPNSNSFTWWIFHRCSINLTPVFSKYPFVGIDYFWPNDLL